MPNELNEAMEMHQKIASSAGELSDSGHLLGTIVPRLERVRGCIDQSSASRAELIAKQYKLRVPGEFSSWLRRRRIAIPVPPQYHNSATPKELVAKARSDEMSSLPELGCAGQILSAASIHESITWVKHESLAPEEGDLQAQLVIREVEALFFLTASQGLHRGRCCQSGTCRCHEDDRADLPLQSRYRSFPVNKIWSRPYGSGDEKPGKAHLLDRVRGRV